MRGLLIALLSAAILFADFSCKQGGHKNYAVTAEEDDEKDDVDTGKLALDNGAKWKVDSITDANVHNLQDILQKFNTTGEEHSSTDCTNVQNDLRYGIDKMISECKMKGPNHKALHQWLKPLIGQVGNLKKTMGVPDAIAACKVIKSRLDMYNQYFEL